MCFRGTKVTKHPFEFQRNGPVVKGPGGHKPDFTLQITRPSQNSRYRAQTSHASRTSKMYTIDPVILVEAAKTSNLKKCKEIDLSSRKLGKIDMNTLRELQNLKRLDVSDNSLSLVPFSVLPNLEDLDLSCNGIRKFDFTESETLVHSGEAWVAMKKLNVAYNSLSNHITDIMLMPNLSWLNLSNNNISKLPPNMMHFANIKYLDLTGNKLNSQQAFFALATVPLLETLILDKNMIEQIPTIDFGFENLVNLSVKNNEFTSAEDLCPIVAIESLTEINITRNPVCLKLKEIPYVKQLFKDANINVIMNEPKKPKSEVIPSKLRTIAFDPLCLPTFTKKHIDALNKKTPRKMDDDTDNEDQYIEKSENVESNVFITDVGNVAQDDEPKPLDIPETPLPNEDDDVEENQKINIWDEIPVVQGETRKQLSTRTKTLFDDAFRKLVFIVNHPDLRLRPRESPSTELPETTPRTPVVNLITRPVPNMLVAPRKKRKVASQLQARTEYTKTEIQQMLRSMEGRLSNVETDLLKVDESGHTAVEVALDQQNFTTLHKQYETIRAELINTLNS